MGKQILQKYTVFEVKRQLADMEKQYGKEQVAEMLGEGRAAEIDREFKKAVAERLEPYWKGYSGVRTRRLLGAATRSAQIHLPRPQCRMRRAEIRPASHRG